MEKKLYRSKSDQKVAGVCGGVAKYFGIDSTLIRLIWALAIVCAGAGVLAYIVCAFVIPEEPEDYVEVQ